MSTDVKCPRGGQLGDRFATLNLGPGIGCVQIYADPDMHPDKVLELTEVLIRLRREERRRKDLQNTEVK